jgi:hypothetical protein
VVEPWNREAWIVTRYRYYDDVAGAHYIREYTEGYEFVAEYQADEHCASDLPEDGVFGYGAVEIWLTDLLSGLPAGAPCVRRYLSRHGALALATETAKAAQDICELVIKAAK